MFKSTENNRPIICTAFFILCFLLVLTGCQSTLDVAGEEHKTVTDKWKELSKYAESNIEDYGITINARLAISADQKFKLTHFKLSSRQSRQDINLLSPNFEHKYICSPKCYQLIEYFNLSGEDGTTLLTNYFDRHEFELFKFYGDIQLLNKQLAKLAVHDQRLLKSYLTSLAYQRISFESANDFILFLTTSLTVSALESFSENPEDLFSNFLKNYQSVNGGQWTGDRTEHDDWTSVSKEQNEWTGIIMENNEWTNITDEQKKWAITTDEQDKWTGVSQEQSAWADVSEEQSEWTEVNKEHNGWTASSELPEKTWSAKLTVLPEALWMKEASDQKNSKVDGEPTGKEGLNNDQLAWQSAKASPILIGHNVCSYRESYFGVVVALSFDTVTVNLLGQAKVIREGVVYPAEQGDLFTLNENLYFSPITEKRTFDKADLASCILE